MKLFTQIASLLVLGFALIGCSSPKDKIAGEWVFDKASLQSDPEFQKMKGPEREIALKMADKMLSTMTFEFKKDGKMLSKMGKQVQEGSYVIKGKKDNVFTLTTTIKRGKREDTEDLRIELKDDAHMVLTGPDGQSVPFKRK